MRDWTIPPHFVLKVTPPRAPRGFVTRQRLRLERLGLSREQAVVVEAPAGYGKTSMLVQWRRECLGEGAVVAWLSMDESDDARTLVYGLGCAMHVASGRRAFGQPFMGWIQQVEDVTEALTGWLAEVAELAVNTVVFLDLGNRLPVAALRDALAYLVRNAPPNLRIILGGRSVSSSPTHFHDAGSLGDWSRITASDLAFQLDETVMVLRTWFDCRFDPDSAARLHTLTEGWPLGLQLAATALRRSPDLNAAIAAISVPKNDIQNYFFETFLSVLPQEVVHFLVRISVFDAIHSDLCVAATGNADAAGLLDRLRLETPVFVEVEGSPWIRMHPLAREVLLNRFKGIRLPERVALSRRASEWLAAAEHFEEAARHALLAGDDERVYALIEQGSHESYAKGVLLDWFDRLPAAEIEQRPLLQFTTAWALASGSRYAEAERIVRKILTQPNLSPGRRFEAALISAVIANFADRLDECEGIFAEWAEVPAGVEPHIRRARAILHAMVELHQGETEKSRLRLLLENSRTAVEIDLSLAFRDFGVVLSYLWEGQISLAIDTSRSALADAERNMGRRSPIACMIASVLAQALWERGLGDEARLLLTHRLDVIEHTGLPDTIIVAYLTLACLSDDAGNEATAISLLDGLYALGGVRKMPRLCVAALGELVRMHAVRGRPETAAEVAARLDAMVAESDALKGLFESWTSLHRARAHAYAALARDDWSSMIAFLSTAGECAGRLRRQRDAVEIRLLRALAVERMGGDGSKLYYESVSLALASGMEQVLRSIHPEITETLSRRFDCIGRKGGGDTAEKPVRVSAMPRSALLTEKEQEILVVMARGMSNKEIALALDVGEETIKWHVKNMFRKLGAGTRRQAVSRAGLLGLIGPLS